MCRRNASALILTSGISRDTPTRITWLAVFAGAWLSGWLVEISTDLQTGLLLYGSHKAGLNNRK